jgi:hypothetical protein
MLETGRSEWAAAICHGAADHAGQPRESRRISLITGRAVGQWDMSLVLSDPTIVNR